MWHGAYLNARGENRNGFVSKKENALILKKGLAPRITACILDSQ